MFHFGGGFKMVYGCGKRKTNIELGAGVGADFD